MKVYKNKYKNHWVSPYKICEKICWWREIDYDEPWVKGVNKVLNPVCELWQKFLDIVDPKIDYVKIDPWDTWSMDSTLSPIILPMLRQLQKDKHGSPFVDDKDVPKELRSTSAPAKANEWDVDDNHFKRWDWVLNEMIWAFEQLCADDWEAQYASGEIDHNWVVSDYDENGKAKLWSMEEGPNHTYKMDMAGRAKHQKRINNGLRLFGTYYQNLWD